MAEIHFPPVKPTPAAPYPNRVDRRAGFHGRTRRARISSAPAQDQRFLTLVHSFQNTGGLAWVGDLEHMFMLRSTGSARDFSESIADRQVVHFEWQAQTWLPLFQFNLVRMQPHAALASILGKLNGIYNNGEVAEWFSRANLQLKGCSPSQMLATHPEAVVDAASAEVFLLRG